MSKKEEHIFFFNSHAEWGGGEKWHAETSFHLYKKKYAVALLAHRYGRLIKRMKYDMPVMSVLLSNLSYLNPIRYLQLVRIFKQYSVKTIILCLPIDLKVAGVAAKIAGVQNIIYRRGSAIPIKDSWYNRYLFSKVITNVIANSEATANTILENNKELISRDKIKVIYNGIDIPKLKEKSENKRIVIAAAGRLEYQKNFTVLIDIAELLKKKGYDFVIKIAGRGEDETMLKEKIKKWSLDKYIELVGFKPDLAKFLRASDIFVLPSHWEGFGFVLAEAMAQELPLVAFNVSSNPELITDGENGYLVPWGNLNDFANRVGQLIESKELREKQGKNGRDRAIRDFSSKVALKNVEEYLTQLENNY